MESETLGTNEEAKVEAFGKHDQYNEKALEITCATARVAGESPPVLLLLADAEGRGRRHHVGGYAQLTTHLAQHHSNSTAQVKRPVLMAPWHESTLVGLRGHPHYNSARRKLWVARKHSTSCTLHHSDQNGNVKVQRVSHCAPAALCRRAERNLEQASTCNSSASFAKERTLSPQKVCSTLRANRPNFQRLRLLGAHCFVSSTAALSLQLLCRRMMCASAASRCLTGY